MTVVEAPELRDSVTFLLNRKEPIHNWYWYKEGYSKQLVDGFISRFGLAKKAVVLDPFCGVGTTVLACKQAGIPSIGMEISPLLSFVSKVKTTDYDLKELKAAIKEMGEWKFERPEIPKQDYIRRFFSKYALQDIVFYKNRIEEIRDRDVRDFFLLALVDSATKASWMVKERSLVRKRKRQSPPVRRLFKAKVKRMYKSLVKCRPPGVRTEIISGSAMKMELKDESIDAVITSPPYLGKPEYIKKYRVELALFFNYPKPALVGHMGKSEKDYFNDMKKVMKELYRVCKPNAKLAVVIGGGCMKDRVVMVDERLAEISEKTGFDCKEVLVARRKWCTRDRTAKIGTMRESAVMLEKN